MINNESELRSKIYTIRGVQVMLDSDLAEIYGYETKYFNRQIKNNIERFDEDFMFQLSEQEYEVINLRCKIFTSSLDNNNSISKNLTSRFTSFPFSPSSSVPHTQADMRSAAVCIPVGCAAPIPSPLLCGPGYRYVLKTLFYSHRHFHEVP